MEQAAPSGSHFSHMQGPRTDGVPLQNTTRYLCAAAYLDQAFARKVIREFVEDGHRGVVPSFGFDVAPVIAHCLRARRMRVTRDVTSWALGVLLASVLDEYAVALAYSLAAIGVLALIPWSRIGRLGRIMAVALAFYVITAAGIGLFSLLSGGQPYDSSGQDAYGGVQESVGSGGAMHIALGTVLVLFVIALPPIGYRVFVYRTLQRLGPGSQEPPPRPKSSRVKQALDRVAAAQRGNVTLYSGENPFLGSGEITAPWARAWSIAVKLDRASTSFPGLAKEPGPKNVDPVALHHHVHRQLVAMRDGLPPNERVGGLLVDWHVVAQGDCLQGTRPVDPSGTEPRFHGHPLIDAERSVPFSQATEDTVAAVIRHPQANVRCYLRVTVGTQGQAVRDRTGAPIAPAEDQDILLSAFLYLAVEGRMLYAQFVANVMPPIRQPFRIVDVLPSYTMGGIIWQALKEGGTRALGEGSVALYRLIRTLWQMGRARLNSIGPLPVSFLSYDYGARISVREEASEPGFRTFMQTLDVDKYTNMIERRINEAVLDYLEQCDVNVTAYREQAAVVLNSPFIMTGGSISGSQVAVGGPGSHIAQQQSRPNP